MGEVYRARDTRLGRDVAIKVLLRHLASSPDGRARFRREAKAISSLNHPHICVLHDIGQEGETEYIVMELVEGETLASRIAKGPIPTTEVLRIGAQVADALEQAHRAGVAHRDIKPGNVMLTQSGAKLMDFGLAREFKPTERDPEATVTGLGAHHEESITRRGTIVGTYQYMAPEQLEGRRADARSDIWALGCVLYEMATGKRAFDGSTPVSVISAIMRDEPRRISEMSPLTPAAFDHVVRSCLAKNANDRIQTAHDLKLQLQVIAETASQGRTQSPLSPRYSIASTIFFMVIAACVLLVGYQLSRRGIGNKGLHTGSDASLAVLPFEDLSPRGDQAYLAEGLSEELTNSLAEVPGLRVVSQTSSSSFDGKNVDLAGLRRMLGVGMVVQGSVRESAKHLRVTATLVRVQDGSHLWSQTYDRQLVDIFEVQQDIARSVSAEVNLFLRLAPSESLIAAGIDRTSQRRKSTPEAYRLYLQGKYLLYQGRAATQALDCFKKSLEIDPKYALAWAQLSRAYMRVAGGPWPERDRMAMEAARRGVEFGPDLAETHARLGWMQLRAFDFRDAEASYRRAMQIDSVNADVLRGVAALADALGDRNRSLELNRRSADNDPLNFNSWLNLGNAMAKVGHTDGAVEALQKAVDIVPNADWVRVSLVGVLLNDGRPKEALEQADQMKPGALKSWCLADAYYRVGRKHQSDSLVLWLEVTHYGDDSPYAMASLYSQREDADRTFYWLLRAYDCRDPDMIWIKDDPDMQPLHSDPRWVALMRKMGLG